MLTQHSNNLFNLIWRFLEHRQLAFEHNTERLDISCLLKKRTNIIYTSAFIILCTFLWVRMLWSMDGHDWVNVLIGSSLTIDEIFLFGRWLKRFQQYSDLSVLCSSKVHLLFPLLGPILYWAYYINSTVILCIYHHCVCLYQWIASSL